MSWTRPGSSGGLARRLLLLAPSLLGGCSPARLVSALAPGGGYALRRDLAYGAGPRQRLDLYLPRGEARALVVFLYGGGWQGGSRAEYGFVAQALTGLGCATALPDYRLYPEVRWPGFLEDAALAATWLRGPTAREAGLAGAPLLLAGHSAGAFNAMALALDPRWLEAAGLPGGRAGLAGAIGLAGPYAFRPRNPPYPAIFAAAPQGYARAAPEDPALLRGAPPLLLLHGEADRTAEPDQSRRLAERVGQAGGTVTLRLYPGVGHTGIIAALAAPLRALGLASAPVRDDIAGFLAERLAV
jgi:acetyl esterase/lipase